MTAHETALQKLQVKVGGMACSFCVGSLEKALERLPGVQAASVSLAHEEALVQYDPVQVSETEIKQTFRDMGYTVRDPDKVKAFEEQQHELRTARRRLGVAGLFTVLALGLMVLMWLQKGIVVDGQFTDTDRPAMAWAALALALATTFGPGRYILKKAYQSAKRGILNQHVLLEFAAFGGLLGGLLGMATLYSPTARAVLGEPFPIVHFFAVSVFVTAYHVLSGWASLLVRTRASQSVQKLLDLRPETALVLRDDGTEEEVPVQDVRVGDLVRVRPGMSVPVDGRVVEGASTVDESLVTGEPMPVERGPGDEVIGGSLNGTGALKVRVMRVGEEAFLNQVARHVQEARALKPGILQLADLVIRYFVPGVLIVAGAAFLFWTLGAGLLWGQALWGRAAFAALAVLVMGYPCALGMATPLALVRGGGMAAERGILMRSGEAFQVFKDVTHVVLDKTGTITMGRPAVVEVVPAPGRSRAEVLSSAAGAEAASEHPLARAVLQAAQEEGIRWTEGGDFQSYSGRGVQARVEGALVLVGKPDWLRDHGVDLDSVSGKIEALEEKGHTVVAVAAEGALVGLLAIADPIKADAPEAIARMKRAGLAPLILTGDNARTARAVAARVGIEEVLAGVLPDRKAAKIRELQAQGHRVVMVGDGINDAPALMQADVGIAIGAGTDIAIESSDVVLIGERLGGVIDAYHIGKASYRKTQQNLAIAFSFNGIGVPAAATGLVHPVFAMAAMLLSVTAVLANSFAGRLLGKPYHPPEPQVQKTESSTARVETTFHVPAMHCEGCLRTIRAGLTPLPGVEAVEGELGAKRIRVLYKPNQIDEARICARLSELGFGAGCDEV